MGECVYVYVFEEEQIKESTSSKRIKSHNLHINIYLFSGITELEFSNGRGSSFQCRRAC